MSLPEVRMSFPDRAALARELDQNLKHGRAFLNQSTDLPVLSECTLVIVHPDHGAELHLPAQVVMVNASGPMCGIGLALRSCTAEDMLRLTNFAVANETQAIAPEPASAATTVPETDPAAAPRASIPPASGKPPATSAPPVMHQTYVPPAPVSVAPTTRSTRPSAAPAPDTTSAPPLMHQTFVPPPEAHPSTPPQSAPTQPPDANPATAEPPPTAAADDRVGDGDDALPNAEVLEDELPLEHESELSLEDAAVSGDADGASHAAHTDLQADNKQDRLRHLTVPQQLKVARTGELSDRVTVERLYGKQVWEALLSNPRISLPEVSRIARKGTVPKPLLEQILENGAWIKNDAVRRALLSNPKLGSESILKLLRLTPKHELKNIDKGSAYGPAVREAARKLLKQ